MFDKVPPYVWVIFIGFKLLFFLFAWRVASELDRLNKAEKEQAKRQDKKVNKTKQIKNKI